MDPHASAAHCRTQTAPSSLFDEARFREQLLGFIAACLAPVNSYDDFRAIVRQHVRPLLPHRMALIGIGRTLLGNVFIDHLIPVDFPEQLATHLNRRSSLTERPVIEHWLNTGRPVLIERGHNFHLLSGLERWENETFQLGSLAIHGQLDMSGRMASYYCFCQIEELSDKCATILELIIPHLQVALMKAHVAESSGKNSPLLTRKEQEILQWIVMGKTNREIACILEKSELTVRNQVHCILRKLNAATRSEAVQRADEMGLLMQWQSVKFNRFDTTGAKVVGRP